MRNATTDTARRGYQLYLDENCESLEEVNKLLAQEGRESIHARTFRHYTNLDDAGMAFYMPINQFDVLYKAGLLQ